MASNNPWANLLNPNAIQSPAAGKGMLAMNKPAGIGPDGTDFYLQQGPGGQVQSTTAPPALSALPQRMMSQPPLSTSTQSLPPIKIPRLGPSQSQDQRDIQGQIADDINKRNQNTGDYQDQIAKLGDRPSGVDNADFSPLAGLVDSMTGSKLSGSIKAPHKEQEYDAHKMLLQQALEKAQGGVTDDRLKLLKINADQNAKDEMANQKLMLANALAGRPTGVAGARQEANALRANKDYDHVLGDAYEKRLDAANRVRDIIRAAQDGTLIPTENMSSQLANDINLLQANHTTVSGTEHARPSTLFGKGGALVHYLSGDPQAAITQADLAQMGKEADLLYGDIGNQHKAKFASWIKGIPADMRPILNDRFNESRNQYFPQAQAPQNDSSAMVTIMHDNKKLQIPQADLADALKDGATLVK